MKKVIFTIMALFVLVMMAPILPLPVELQKKVLSVMFSDESYAVNAARNIADMMRRPIVWGFADQEAALRWLNAKGRKWTTADGGTRTIFIQPELLGDTGWPTVVNSVNISIMFNRDGSMTRYRYNIHSGFRKV